jgi:hypothetical protein
MIVSIYFGMILMLSYRVMLVFAGCRVCVLCHATDLFITYSCAAGATTPGCWRDSDFLGVIIFETSIETFVQSPRDGFKA